MGRILFPSKLLYRLMSLNNKILEYLYFNLTIFTIHAMFTRRMLFIVTWGWVLAILVCALLLMAVVMLPILFIVTRILFVLTKTKQHENQNRNRSRA